MMNCENRSNELSDVTTDERRQERQCLGSVTASACELIERYGWSRHQVLDALDYELREMLIDSAVDDASFWSRYERWRMDHLK